MRCGPRLTFAAVVLFSAACVGRSGSPPPRMPSTASSPEPSGSIIADDFSDPTSGWDSEPIAEYRDGKLIVGHVDPGATFIWAPAGFRGSRIVRATASIEGPGASLIGIFCQADGDMSSGYLALVDPASHGARLARLQDRRAITIAQGPLEYDVALDQPLDLELRCVKRKKVYWFRFTIDGTTTLQGADRSQTDGELGGVYFYHSQAGTFGVFDDFQMIPLDASERATGRQT